MISNYYTFRRLSQYDFECTKWEEHRSEPIETYKICKRGSYRCDCPAHVSFCRHASMLKDLIDFDTINEHWAYYHDGEGWHFAKDQNKLWEALEQV